MNSNEIFLIREWAPLNLNESIPSSTNGVFSQDITFTCIDAIEEFLAIGTNVGIVYFCNRNGEIKKLRTEANSRITCVKIVDSVEYMIAAGCSNGQISIFRIQKPQPPDLNLVAPSKPMERYTIKDLHHMPVTCCEWSKNGMKLYSGDRQGIVVLTELAYPEHLSKSVEILSEAYEIVQLNVYQSYLLVSTLYRAIICQRDTQTGQWKIKQVGKKDREQMIDCGGIILKRESTQLLLVLGRPGLRFWFADIEGNVEKTLMFHDAIMFSSAWEIPLLNPKTPNPITKNDEAQNFRTFHLYPGAKKLIVTHDETTLFILNIDCLRVEAIARGFRKILDFCVCDKEIFVLEGDRSVIRLAPAPEKPNKSSQIIFNPSLPPPLPILGAAAIGVLESPTESVPVEQCITNAKECFELPPIQPIDMNIPIELAVESPRAEQNRRLQIFNEISEMDFDQSILHRSGLLINGPKRQKSKSSERRTETATGIVEIGHVAKANDENNEVDEKLQNVGTAEQTNYAEQQMIHPTIMEASFCPYTVPERHLSLSLEVKQNSYPKAFTQTHISPISPIAAEEFERAQCFAASTMITQNSVGFLGQQQQQPSEFKPIKNAGSQPSDSVHDYSAGQPVDDIIAALQSTVLIDDSQDEVKKPNENSSLNASQQHQQRQFVALQPLAEEVQSFRPDFRRIPKSPPPSGGSGTSNEWEFLDN